MEADLIDEKQKKLVDVSEGLEKRVTVIEKELEKRTQELEELNEKLEEKRLELEEEESLNSLLLKKQRQGNDEIQEARKELIRGLRDLSGDGKATIRVKRMGEIDEKPFIKACEQRFSGKNIELKHATLYSKWQDTIKDGAWHPFKRVGTGEQMKDVVDEDDEKLKNLSEEWGEDVKNAVKTALAELHEYNPSGMYTVPVLWNFEQERQATLKEGIAFIMQQVKVKLTST